MGFFDNLKNMFSGSAEEQVLDAGLDKTKKGLVSQLSDFFMGKKVDEEFFEELEEILIMGDVGAPTAVKLAEELRVFAEDGGITETSLLKEKFAEMTAAELEADAKGLNLIDGELNIILVVGVNGAGKTTSIGKMAHYFKNRGKKVVLAAADTFRAAAIEQLKVWGDRTDFPVISQNIGSDPAAVVFDSISSARSRQADVLIVDTAGRLQNKTNLMKELEKIRRIIERECPGALREVLLVLDANTGQNAMSQAKLFSEVAGVTGLILTKLDGTAKGGMVIGVKSELGIPVRFIGVGEKIEDLQEFDADRFVAALFSDFMEDTDNEAY